MLVFPRDVEVFCLSASVVGRDKLFDYFGQIVLFGQFQSTRYMTDNYLCALFVTQVLVRIDSSGLVFGKEY